MKRLLLAGLNHETLVLARDLGYDVVRVVDPICATETWRDLPASTRDEDALRAGDFDGVIIAIDRPEARRKVQGYYEAAGLRVADLIAGPIGEDSRYGRGLLMQRGAHVSVDASLGDGVRMNYGAKVTHDVVLGDFVTVGPNAVVLGHVTVGDLSYIGANATILPRLRIGSDCIVGAGAVVTADVPDGATVMGNPAR